MTTWRALDMLEIITIYIDIAHIITSATNRWLGINSSRNGGMLGSDVLGTDNVRIGIDESTTSWKWSQRILLQLGTAA